MTDTKLRWAVLVMAYLLIAVSAWQAITISRLETVVRDQQTYMDNGCNGRYQGESYQITSKRRD